MAVHLIETSEEDSYLAVARHVSDLLNEGQVSRRYLCCVPVVLGTFELGETSQIWQRRWPLALSPS